MKTIINFSLGTFMALAVLVSEVQAATSERLLTIALKGFDQFVDQRTGDDVAIPFRLTTRDLLFQITDATGTNVDGGLLIAIDSLDDPDAPTRIVARTRDVQLDVSDFFTITQGEFVRTVKFSRNIFRGATYYAIDQFQFSAVFSTHGDTNGIDLLLQGFSKETQRVQTKKIGGVRQVVTSSTLKSKGNGDLLDFVSTNRFVSPFEGTVRFGSARFYP